MSSVQELRRIVGRAVGRLTRHRNLAEEGQLRQDLRDAELEAISTRFGTGWPNDHTATAFHDAVDERGDAATSTKRKSRRDREP